MIDVKEQAQAIATLKEDEELNKEVLNNSVEITLQKFERNKELSAEQEDFIIESQLELIRERREEDI